MASDKVYIYDSDDIRLNVIDESNIDVTIINESPSVEVITVYEQGPQGPRGEKGDTPDLPTEIISGSGADSLIPIFVNGGYITGSQRLYLSGSTLGVSGSLYIGTVIGNSVNIAGFDSGNKLSTIYIGSGLNLDDNTLNAVGSLTGTGSIYQVSYWTSSTAISGSPGFTFDPVSSDLTVAGTLYANTFSGSDAYLSGDVFVGGKVTAQEFHTDYVSSSIIYESGSTQFGNSLDDTHIFTGSIYVSGSINTVSHIDFSTSSVSPIVPGRISWNPDFGTLDLGAVGGNVNLSWGLELAAYIVNGELDTLLDGEVVYMSGSRGDKPKVYRASNSMESTSTKTFGVVTEHILPNQLGYVTTQGVVNGLDLSMYNPGDAVWLGSTPGTFTVQKPQAPSHSVFVGIVQRANAGDGQLYVSVQNGYELDELHNVRIVSPTNGNLIAYDSSDGLWKNTNTILNGIVISGSDNSQLLRVASPSNQNILLVSGSGNIGISTSTPAYKLDVAGSQRILDSLIIAQTGLLRSATVAMGNDFSLTHSHGSFNIYQGSTWYARFANSGNSFLNTTLNVGNVGVTTHLGAALGVKGYGTTSSTTGLLVQNSAGSTSLLVRDDRRITNGDSTFYTDIYTTGGKTAHIENSGHWGSIGLFVKSSTGLIAETATGAGANGPTAASIWAKGYVGSSPAGSILLGLLSNRALISAGNALTMHTSSMFQIDSTVSGFLPPRMTAAQRNAIGTPATGLSVYNTTTNTNDVYNGSVWNPQVYGSGSLNYLTFWTGSNSISSENSNGWLLWDSINKRLSIGDNNPSYTLDVSGSGNFTGDLIVTGSLTFGTITGSSAYLTGDVFVGGKVTAQEFFTQYVSSSIIYQSGSTKFGDTTDDIHQRTGSMLITGSFSSVGSFSSNGSATFSVNGGSVKLQGALGGGLQYSYAEYIGSTYTAGFKADTNMSLRTADASRLFLSNTNLPDGLTLFGNKVGLGNPTPTSKLHISGSSNSALFEIDSDSNQNIIFVSGSGNVGFGTNTPAYPLDVLKQTSGATILSRFTSQTQGNYVEILAGASYAGSIAGYQNASTKRWELTNEGNLILSHPSSTPTISAVGALTISSTSVSMNLVRAATGITATGSISLTNGSFQLSSSLFQYSDNTDVDTGTEVVATIPTGSYRSAFFDYVISSGSNARAGTVFSVWGGSSVEYTETSTNDIGNTTPVSLFAALNGANIELRATTTADNWSVKSLVRML